LQVNVAVFRALSKNFSGKDGSAPRKNWPVYLCRLRHVKTFELLSAGTNKFQNSFLPYCLRYYDYPRPSIVLIDYIVAIVPIQTLSTVGDRAFPVAVARLWNSLPSHVTAVPSLFPSSAVVLNHISSHFLIPLSDFSFICTVPAQ